MKSILILGDGMADYPLDELGGKTPLMAARTPHLDKLCAKSRTGRFISIPEGMPPGSEVANLAVLGYNVSEVYQGRGVLEAASMGVTLALDDLAMRCNLICIEAEKIKNHSAGHISSEEARRIISSLNEAFGSDALRFYPGVSYRHLCVLKGGSRDIACTPPHDVPGTPFKEVLIQSTKPDGESTAAFLNDLIIKSQTILSSHPVNQSRIQKGKDPASSVWFWAQGYKPAMETLNERFGVSSAVISAVDLIKGLGVYAGADIIDVKGATGLYDTNYEGKADAAVNALESVDFVYLHIEASDEAGHEGDAILKVKTIEYLDSRVVGRIMGRLEKLDTPVSIAVLPDHPTPCAVRTHTRDPVPFMICHPNVAPDSVTEYNEISVENGSYGLLQGDELIRALLCP
jgi:2,3-bisphosphoglycerate-independent phosphoglycerate mutase